MHTEGMMVREIDLEQMAHNLEQALADVEQREDKLIVVQDGKPRAALVPVEMFERWFADRKVAFQYLDRRAERAPDYSEEEVKADVEQAVRETRETDAP